MERIYEIVYPDDPGGYKCYSIQVWKIDLERQKDWGTFRVYILEGRFIWCGVLARHRLEIQEHGEGQILEKASIINKTWRFLMDELLRKEIQEDG
jgi:hypothetical protein